jgi:hypothetical protein
MNSRRSFFKQLLMGGAAFAILPPALTYERLWKAQRQIVLPPYSITCAEFSQMLINEMPRYEALILENWLPQSEAWEILEAPDRRIINPCEISG